MTSLRSLLRWLLRLTLAVTLVVVTVYLVRAIDSRSLLPLKAEHQVRFNQEFRAEQEADTDWAAYLDLEERLAVEARTTIGIRASGPDALDRYGADSLSNPDSYSPNWNHSYNLRPEAPRGATVLLHGLSDSPYSMRATAQLMRSQGLSAYSPRMPGHGFAVGDLRHATWDDWMAVVRIAMRAADEERRPGQPLFLVGYSNGGLLAIRYALDCGNDERMPCPDGILLLSPAIEITPFAVFAHWHQAVSWLEYFEKFQWENILPEVDPYKFTSFPKNPGLELHEAAREVNADLVAAPKDLPPLLVFQSAVDDTVSTHAVIDLLRALPPNGSELVVYDVNRSDYMVDLMNQPPLDLVQVVKDELPLPIEVTIVTNKAPDSLTVHTIHFDGIDRTPSTEDLPLAWSRTAFSLSHIAIPFSPSDPIYGTTLSDDFLNLASIAPRGERKVLSLAPNYFARLRNNPFFPYQQQRISRWLERWLEPRSGPGVTVDRE